MNEMPAGFGLSSWPRRSGAPGSIGVGEWVQDSAARFRDDNLRILQQLPAKVRFLRRTPELDSPARPHYPPAFAFSAGAKVPVLRAFRPLQTYQEEVGHVPRL